MNKPRLVLQNLGSRTNICGGQILIVMHRTMTWSASHHCMYKHADTSEQLQYMSTHTRSHNDSYSIQFGSISALQYLLQMKVHSRGIQATCNTSTRTERNAYKRALGCNSGGLVTILLTIPAYITLKALLIRRVS